VSGPFVPYGVVNGQLPFMDIDCRYPVRHRLPPGGSGERAGDYINLGLGLSPLPQREKQRTIYSLDHARSGSNLHSASAAPLSFRSRHLPPFWIIAWIGTIFMEFRGPKALVNLHGCRQPFLTVANHRFCPWPLSRQTSDRNQRLIGTL
jgi:hypothetical protein